jgi:hypothetical protein
MKFLLWSLLIPLNSFALGLELEQPRQPSGKIIRYRITCDNICDYNQPKGKGKVEKAILGPKLQELMKLDPPQQIKLSSSRILYRVKISDQEKIVEYTLGAPSHYKAKEYQKFARIVAAIEEIKLLLRSSK